MVHNRNKIRSGIINNNQGTIGSQVLILWIVIFMIVIVFATMVYLNEHNVYLFIGLLSIVPVSFIVMIIMNAYMLRAFRKIYQNELTTNSDSEIGEVVVQIQKNSYKTKPLEQSFDITINPLFETTKSLYIKSDKKLYLMIHVPNLVIFYRYIRALSFSAEASESNDYKQCIEISEYDKKVIDGNIHLTSSQFPPMLKAIKLPLSLIGKYI